LQYSTSIRPSIHPSRDCCQPSRPSTSDHCDHFVATGRRGGGSTYTGLLPTTTTQRLLSSLGGYKSCTFCTGPSHTHTHARTRTPSCPTTLLASVNGWLAGWLGERGSALQAPKQPRGAWLSPPPPAVCVLAPRGGLSLVCNSDGRPPPCPSCPAAGSFLDAIFNRRTGNQDIALTSIVDDARGSEAFLPWTTEQRPTLIQQDRRATRAAINAQALASAFARSILLCRLWGGTNAQYAPSQPYLDRASWRFWRSVP